MKALNFILVFVALSFFAISQNDTARYVTKNRLALYHCTPNGNINQKDTINVTDIKGLKQGWWVIFGQEKPKTCYTPWQKVEEGRYKDNKKTGIWTSYFCNEKIHSQITFTDGRPKGPVKIYYENGQITEEGTWKVNRWIGRYKYYDPDGTLRQDFIIDNKGNRIVAPK